MRLLHCVSIFYKLPCFCSINVSIQKLQCNAENACGNRMCKRPFNVITSLEHKIITITFICFLLDVKNIITYLKKIFFWKFLSRRKMWWSKPRRSQISLSRYSRECRQWRSGNCIVNCQIGSEIAFVKEFPKTALKLPQP